MSENTSPSPIQSGMFTTSGSRSSFFASRHADQTASTRLAAFGARQDPPQPGDVHAGTAVHLHAAVVDVAGFLVGPAREHVDLVAELYHRRSHPTDVERDPTDARVRRVLHRDEQDLHRRRPTGASVVTAARALVTDQTAAPGRLPPSSSSAP